MQTPQSLPLALPLFGLAVSEGTGPELATIFERAVAAFGEAARTTVHVERSTTRYRTFGGVTQAGLTASEVARSAERDALAYEAFVRGLVARGCRAVFRTAFNAQPLYVVRERLGAVKVEMLPNDGGEIVLVRDQSQGFYAGTNNSAGEPDEILRTCRFSRAATWRVLDFAIAEAARRFGGSERIEGSLAAARPSTGIDAVVMAYKFHLLDLRFANWVADYARERAIEVRVFQPDTMNRNLMRGHYRGKNVVVVGGNEWGDIMHADLLARAGLGSQDERCSLNVYLDPELDGLSEYQTVHGSADDIAGRARVNPTATLRAAALMLEAHAGFAGLGAALEEGLREALSAGIATPDVGGSSDTDVVAAKVIERTLVAWRKLAVPAAKSATIAARPERGPSQSDTALLIVDMQRDFCAPDGRFAELGLIDPARTAALIDPLQSLLGTARERGLPVFFVRTVADEGRLPATVVERHRRHGRGGYLAPNQPGSEFFGVEPLTGDEVVTKVGYDAFLGTDLEARLTERGVRHLILAGVFSDLCVDTLARTAFQKGYRVTLISDATLPLQRDAREVAAFMTTFYDATILRAADLWRESGLNMLSEDDNRVLTRVGPGTRMGALLRRYWHPIAAVRELAERPTLPIRILGEDLVLYRDKSGTYGLIDRRCPHRGSDLAYGVVDTTGLRCSYHGWCFDERGRCRDQPFEQVARPDSHFRDKIQVKAYQVRPTAGLIWAYLGPAPAPCLVDWERFHAAGQPSISFTRVPCNWLQCQENSIDPVHFEWLHQNLEHTRANNGKRAPQHLEISFEETDYGFVYRRVLEGSDKADVLWTAGRSTVWPNGLFVGGFVWHVPMDDENTTFVAWDLLPTRRPVEEAHYRRGELEREPGGLYKMHDFVHQDSVGMLGTSTIADRTREALGESDRGVILLRRRLLAEAATLATQGDGWDPKGVTRDESRNRRVPLPYSPDAMPGYEPGGRRARLRAKASALLERAKRLGGGGPGAEVGRPLTLAREALQGLRSRVAKVANADALARVRRLGAPAKAREITELIHGYQLPALLYVFAKLGVADALAGGPKSAAELARSTAAHAPSLERILRGLVERGVIASDGDRYKLTPLSERLRSDVPGSARGIALLAGEEFMPAWGALLHSARTGEAAFHHVFGVSNWEHRRAHPDLGQAYQDLVARGAAWAAERLLDGYDLSRAEHIVDVGGGRGAFLGHLLERHVRARGTVLDQAHVVAGSPALLSEMGVADRCAIAAGDFFVEVPADADVYVLKNVLHNWDDAAARALLATCCRAMTRAGAKLLVLETILPADEERARHTKTADLHMLVIDGGRERTEAEYRGLFSASGLELVRTVPIAAALAALEVTTAR